MIKLLFFGKKVLEVGSQRCVVKRQQIPSIISRNITKRPKIMDKPRTPQRSHTYPDEKKVTPFGWFLLVSLPLYENPGIFWGYFKLLSYFRLLPLALSAWEFGKSKERLGKRI